jgi:hypothetical protein
MNRHSNSYLIEESITALMMWRLCSLTKKSLRLKQLSSPLNQASRKLCAKTESMQTLLRAKKLLQWKTVQGLETWLRTSKQTTMLKQQRLTSMKHLVRAEPRQQTLSIALTESNTYSLAIHINNDLYLSQAELMLNDISQISQFSSLPNYFNNNILKS